MQLRIKRADFLKGIQMVQSAVSQKNTLPILANLLLEAGKKNIRLTATDLDIGISADIDAETQIEGAITIPAKKLFDIIKELPDEDTVTIVVKKSNMVTIDCGTVHFKIIGLPKDEFPQIPEFKNIEPITIPQEILKRLLSETHFAVSKDETRYILNGVLFIISGGEIRLVATDGRRLAVAANTLPEKTGMEKKAIIPSKTMHELIKMLGTEGAVKILFGNNQVFFDLGKTKVISRLIEGDFPNYEQVIPKEKKEKVTVNREQFLAAARRASLFTNPDSLAVKMDVSKTAMTISKNAPYIGEVKEDVAVSYNGKNISIGFNPAYLIDVLKSLGDEDVRVELDDAEKPGVIRKASDYVYVVLPMQVT